MTQPDKKNKERRVLELSNITHTYSNVNRTFVIATSSHLTLSKPIHFLLAKQMNARIQIIVGPPMQA
jgi:hypothetical protein